MKCQATFKEYCQFPKCDCDRPRGNYEDRHTPDTGFRVYVPKKAKIKFNGGRGALLCERCNVIIKADFDPLTIEDVHHYCEKHTPTNT